MRILRALSRWLVPAAVLAAVLAAAVLSPMVQTWAAQMMLARRPALRGSLGWVTARFGTVRISDLRLTLDGAVLTVPSIEARLPLTTAVWKRRLAVRRLAAKGWKLDLRGLPERGGGTGGAAAGESPSAPATATPAAPPSADAAARVFLGLLSRWTLPCDLSLDGVDLEGDILAPAPGGGAPASMHVTVHGGGLAVGHEGEFAFDAATGYLDLKDAVINIGAKGRLRVTMPTPRTFGRFEMNADLSADGGPFPAGFALSADVAEQAGPGAETYSVDLRQGDRHLATLSFRYPENADRLAGTWRLEAQDSDVAPYLPALKLPRFTAKGGGEFDTDLGFSQVQVKGRVNAAVSQLQAVGPFLARLDHAVVDVDFDARQDGKSLRVDRLAVALTGDKPAIEARALQPFEIDAASGALRPAQAANDWMDVSLRGVPLDWLSDFTPAITFSGGDAAGDFVVRTEKGKFDFRSKTPLKAAGVSLECGRRMVGRKLDLSAPLVGDYGPTGWSFEAAPLSVGSGGDHLAEIQLKASRPAATDQGATVKGSWKADLQAPGIKAALPDLGWIGGRSASGDFTVALGAITELEGRVTVTGRDEHRSATASVEGSVDESGRISFKAPLKIAFGPSVSDLAIDGILIRGEGRTDLYLKLNGKSADLEHLRRLTGAVAAAEGLPLAAVAGGEPMGPGRDTIPFWGDWSGRIAVTLDRLRAGSLTLENVGGALQVDHGSVHLEDGRLTLAGHNFSGVGGTLSFDAAAATPYRLTATASVEPVEVGSFFPAAPPEGSPLIEGRFAFAGTVAGTGNNFGDLVRHTQEEVRLTSTAGIVRVFKTDVDEAIPPDNESAAADTVGRMGTAVGKFFGVEDADRSARKKVSAPLQAALDVINQTSEIGYDQCSLTAVRNADGSMRLADLVMVAGEVRVTGSGQVRSAPGLSFQAQPLTLNLQLGARGTMAKLFSAAGLLSPQKDDQGYQLLSQPVVFGGTVGHIDNRAWHELLVKSARRKPEPAKKEPETRH